MKTGKWIVIGIVGLATLSVFARPWGEGSGNGPGYGYQDGQQCVREDCPREFEGRGPQRSGLREERGSRKGGGGAHLLRRLLSGGRFADELSLSNEQIEELKSLAYENRKEMISLRAAVQLARLEVETAMDSDTPDEAAVMSAVDQAATAEAAIEKKQIECQLRIKEILTDEQEEKLHERKAEFRKKLRNSDRGPQHKQRGPDKD